MDMIGQKSLRQAWDEFALLYGDRTALVFEDITEKTVSYTYAELNEAINRTANLFASLGVGKGDRVVVQLRNCPEMIFCWFGLAKIGAVMVPVNVHLLQEECGYQLHKCGAAVVVTEKDFLPVYEALCGGGGTSVAHRLLARTDEDRPGVLNFNRLLAAQPAALRTAAPIDNRDAAEFLFTSGTTSKPKAVVITHYNLLHAGYYTAWECSMRSDDVFLTAMPAFHVDCQCTVAMPTFTSGATLVLLEKYSARRFWTQVCKHRATLTECIPLMIRTLLLQPRKCWEKKHCLREVLFYLSLADEEKDAFIERFGVRLLTSYGMTETIVGAIGDRPGDKRKWPSIGKAGFGYEAKIADAQGRELPPGAVGEICLKGVPGKTLFKEYYNDPGKTAEILDADGWLHTGDFGYVDEEGFFYFVDRNVNMIKRSGENISCIEIENVLACHPKIAEAAIVGVPDGIRDEMAKAFVVPRKGEALTEKDVLDYCAARLASFKVPSVVEIRASLPRTSTGKVQKSVLKAESVTAARAGSTGAVPGGSGA